MNTVNVLILIHGMTLDAEPRDHREAYATLWESLKAKQPVLGEAIGQPIGVEYAHEPPGLPDEPKQDQWVTRAENTINCATSYAAIRNDPSPYDHLLKVEDELKTFHLTELASKWLLRPYILTPFKEQVMVRGFTDALYYCSPDGERAVRRAVYRQVLLGLRPYESAERVKLHVVAHSLGVTVAFDFLFGLFAWDEHFAGETPGFVREHQASDLTTEAYMFWRKRRQEGRLVLGSKTSAGGQLPLMMMRKQSLVEKLARGEPLDASVIGVDDKTKLTWKSFYDADDALGFPSRRIFEEQAAIQEYEVNTHWRPDLAHTRYWQNERVIAEAARLIMQNL